MDKLICMMLVERVRRLRTVKARGDGGGLKDRVLAVVGAVEVLVQPAAPTHDASTK